MSSAAAAVMPIISCLLADVDAWCWWWLWWFARVRFVVWLIIRVLPIGNVLVQYCAGTVYNIAYSKCLQNFIIWLLLVQTTGTSTVLSTELLSVVQGRSIAKGFYLLVRTSTVLVPSAQYEYSLPVLVRVMPHTCIYRYSTCRYRYWVRYSYFAVELW